MQKPLLAAINKLLYPLVRILLRNGVAYGVLADVLKRIYVDVAGEEFDIPGRKQTISRISVITGLSRREVGRVKSLTPIEDTEAPKRYNRAARVIGGWIREERYLDAEGQPKTLPLDGDGATFSDLVRQFSGNIPVRAILDELLRVGAVDRVNGNKVRLLVHAYLPRTDEAGMLDILGTDVRDLITTIDHNIRATSKGDGDRYYQRKVVYNNLPQEIIPKLREMSQADAQKLLESIDRWLSKYDRDINPNAEGSGRKRAGVGIYYFEEDYENGRSAS
jgi:hypothetical protein